jgi:hypothetical protein
LSSRNTVAVPLLTCNCWIITLHFRPTTVLASPRSVVTAPSQFATICAQGFKSTPGRKGKQGGIDEGVSPVY